MTIAQIKKSSFLNAALWALLLACSANIEAEQPGNSPEKFRRCAACHLPSAEGVTGMFPPLTRRLGALADTDIGRDYLVMVIEAGLMGKIVVDGAVYQGLMPPQSTGLEDEELASILNYLLNNFNAETLAKDWRRFTASEVKRVKVRYTQANARDVYVLRQAAFENIK